MAKTKSGLHKEISAIFGGVPIPKADRAKPEQPGPVPSRVGYVPMKAPPDEEQTPQTADPRQQGRRRPKPAPPKALRPNAAAQKKEQVGGRRSKAAITARPSKSASDISPARRKVTVLMVPVLGVILVLVLVRAFRITSQGTSGPALGETAKPPVIAGSGIEIDWQSPPVYAAAARDPMKWPPLSLTQTETDSLIVKGIVHDTDNPYALVGTRIVREGDKVGGATVRKIYQDHVEVEIDGRIVRLYVQPQKDSE